MTKEKEFLEIFNSLEQFLRVEYNQDQSSHPGFMSTLYRIRKSNKNPIISNKFNFDILSQASQIRNIMSHNNDILIPSDSFIKKFGELVQKIRNPLRVEHIMIPFSELKTVTLSDPVETAILLLKQHGYNTIPVIDHGELVGIFTEKSVFDYLSIYKNRTISKDMRIQDILEAIDLNSDPRKYFAFVGRKLSVEDAYKHFDTDLKQRREMLLLLVTEHGEPKEKLLGIVALRDIENALIN